jgi:hypothetical protein
LRILIMAMISLEIDESIFSSKTVSHPSLLSFQNVDTGQISSETPRPKPRDPDGHPPSTSLFLLNQQCQRSDGKNRHRTTNADHPVETYPTFP